MEEIKLKTWKLVSILAILALVSVGATVAATFALGGWNIQAPAFNQPAAVANQASSSLQALAPVTQTNTQTPTLYTPSYTNPQQYGGWGGCWGSSGWGNGAGYPTTGTTATPLTITQGAIPY
ncbi:MAG: hypothetical protein M1490_00515 [Candidatus Bathyarchaeota archaeon]|nr:hypothetical protein [Candidatus Bathyarchaeota archaeon]